MNVVELPFNRFIGIAMSDQPTTCLKLPEGAQYQNHVGSVHASAQMALAEATSGQFLADKLGDRTDIMAVVRRFEAKFSRPALGALWAHAETSPEEFKAALDELASKGRTLFTVRVAVVDGENQVTLKSAVEWFLAVAKQPTSKNKAEAS